MRDHNLRATDIVLIDGNPRIITINGTAYYYPSNPHPPEKKAEPAV